MIITVLLLCFLESYFAFSVKEQIDRRVPTFTDSGWPHFVKNNSFNKFTNILPSGARLQIPTFFFSLSFFICSGENSPFPLSFLFLFLFLFFIFIFIFEGIHLFLFDTAFLPASWLYVTFFYQRNLLTKKKFTWQLVINFFLFFF